jgi:hypothetical protein
MFFLHAQLGGIGHMLELAPSALMIHGAGRDPAIGAFDRKFQQLPVAVAFVGFQHPYGAPFPRQGAGNEKGIAVRFGHALSVMGDIFKFGLDGLIFRNGYVHFLRHLFHPFIPASERADFLYGSFYKKNFGRTGLPLKSFH